MAAPDSFLYEYAVVRYVPRVDREEFINIGLVMLCKRRKWLRGEVRFDPGRILAFDPKVNPETLMNQASIFMRGDVPSADIPVEERYRWLTAVKSAVLQVSPSHPGLLSRAEGIESGESEALGRLDKEFDRLMIELVG